MYSLDEAKIKRPEHQTGEVSQVQVSHVREIR